MNRVTIVQQFRETGYLLSPLLEFHLLVKTVRAGVVSLVFPAYKRFTAVI